MILFYIANEAAEEQNHKMFPGVYFLEGVMVTRIMNHQKRSVMQRQKVTEKVLLIIHLPSPELMG